MRPTTSIYLRLGLALLLVSLWAYTWFVHTPLLGKLYLPLLVAPFLLYSRSTLQSKVVFKSRDIPMALTVLALVVGAFFLLDRFVPDAAGEEFVHSPTFVLSVWALACGVLVLQAYRLRRRHVV